MADLDAAALEEAARQSYEYEGDRKRISFIGWDREPEAVKSEWRASVVVAVRAYLANRPVCVAA